MTACRAMITRYRSSMRRVHRTFGVLLGLVFLQLVLVESGFACRMPGDMTGGRSDAAMPMPMNAGVPSSPTHSGDHAPPCRFPWAPDGCQSMAPCSPAAVAAPPVGGRPVAMPAEAPLRLAVITPASLIRPPEPPPPRA